MQFQGGNWSFVNIKRVIDETYNFIGEIAYLLIYNVTQNIKFNITTEIKILFIFI